jgi:hypothetical protein
MPTQHLKYFISYARADKKTAQPFFDQLKVELNIVNNYKFTPWRDDMMEVGADWHDQIQQAIQSCDFGLLLVSPAFLASEYIRDNELAHFITQSEGRARINKPLVPVFLKSVNMEKVNMRGLESVQIFRDADRKCFAERQGHKKDAFVSELANKIVHKFEG